MVEVLRINAVRGSYIERIIVKVLEVIYRAQGDVVDMGLMVPDMVLRSVLEV
jgi:hypothetical protein